MRVIGTKGAWTVERKQNGIEFVGYPLAGRGRAIRVPVQQDVEIRTEWVVGGKVYREFADAFEAARECGFDHNGRWAADGVDMKGGKIVKGDRDGVIGLLAFGSSKYWKTCGIDPSTTAKVVKMVESTDGPEAQMLVVAKFAPGDKLVVNRVRFIVGREKSNPVIGSEQFKVVVREENGELLWDIEE